MSKDYHKFKPCSECGYRTLRTSGKFSLQLTKDAVCDNCGAKFKYRAMKISRNETDTYREPPEVVDGEPKLTDRDPVWETSDDETPSESQDEAEKESKQGIGEPFSVAEQIANNIQSEAVTSELLSRTEYLDGRPLYEYFEKSRPQYALTEYSETMLLFATEKGLVLITMSSAVDGPEFENRKSEDFGDFCVVNFDYSEINDIIFSKGMASSAVKWDIGEFSYKISTLNESREVTNDFVEYVRGRLDSDTQGANIDRLIGQAESGTVTEQRLREYNGEILKRLEAGEQPHYVLHGNPGYGIKIEGGDEVEDQSVGLTSPGKTFTIKGLW